MHRKKKGLRSWFHGRINIKNHYPKMGTYSEVFPTLAPILNFPNFLRWPSIKWPLTILPICQPFWQFWKRVGNPDLIFSSTSYWARFKSSEFKYLIMSLRVACDIQALRIINLFCQNRPIFHRGRKPTVCMSCTQLRSLLNDAFPRVLWLQKSWVMVTSQLFCKNLFFSEENRKHICSLAKCIIAC